MSDDDEMVVVERGDPLARIYDYFKHLTTVSLVSIGGVFGLLQGDGPKLKPVATLVILGVIAAAGGISMISASVIASVELRGPSTDRFRKWVGVVQLITTCMLLFGLGIFIGVFSRILK
jgi:hypothetical protein